MNGPEWCTIESDPGVFTELISKFGVQDVQVEELWGLEDADFARLSPVHGLIFLFKWDSSQQSEVSENVLDEVPEGVFFAKQTINNACATTAILSILLNRAKQLELGQTLTDFLGFTSALDAEAFHFISYVPVNGFLYELDGLQKGPRLIDSCEESDWFAKARNVLQQRMAAYAEKELRFTLLALCGDQRLKLQKELGACGDDAARKAELEQAIAAENEKREKWKIENIRRRHNYFPFILNLLGMLGRKGLLKDLTERAKEKKKEKIARAEEEKKKREEAATKAQDEATKKKLDFDAQ